MNAPTRQVNDGDETGMAANSYPSNPQPSGDAPKEVKFQELWSCPARDVVPSAIWPKHDDGSKKLVKDWSRETKAGLVDIARLIKNVAWVRLELEEKVQARQQDKNNNDAHVVWLLPQDVESVYNTVKAMTPKQRSQLDKGDAAPPPPQTTKRSAEDPLSAPSGKRAKPEKIPTSSKQQYSLLYQAQEGLIDIFDEKTPSCAKAVSQIIDHMKEAHKGTAEENKQLVEEKKRIARENRRVTAENEVLKRQLARYKAADPTLPPSSLSVSTKDASTQTDPDALAPVPYDDKLARLRFHNGQVSAEKFALKQRDTEREAEFKDQISRVKADKAWVEEQCEKKTTSLKENYENKMASLKEDQKAEIASLKADHKKEIATLKSGHRRKAE